ncbi:MAG TPA: DoxX-like family protein [Terracidiphilus sp.]|nr:DoxX-like family protein [Terracidiphilus sp.]
MTAPSPIIVRSAIAAVWLYEGLWCKVLGRLPSQLEVVSAVPRIGVRFGLAFLKTLGVLEALIAVWAFSGIAPAACAVTQVVLLIALNGNGLLWARHRIHDPAGMVIKNLAFLVLVWISGTLPPR